MNVESGHLEAVLILNCSDNVRLYEDQENFFVVFALLYFIPNGCLACSCLGISVPDAFEDADIVFFGKVVNVQHSSYIFDSTFEVEKSWKGINTEHFTMRTFATMCGYTFEKGQNYIVFGYKDDEGYYTTGLCSQTVKASKGEEQLKYLGQKATLPLRHVLSVLWRLLLITAIIVMIFMMLGYLVGEMLNRAA